MTVVIFFETQKSPSYDNGQFQGKKLQSHENEVKF